jgi:uncharacterized Zn-binding protein involved in type VI secretion
MPAVAKVGVDTITTGHLCDTTAGILGQLQNKVLVNGSPAAVKGDAIALHNWKPGSSCVPHTGVKITEGSSKVTIMGYPIARVGDSADAGAVASGSGTCSAGG